MLKHSHLSKFINDTIVFIKNHKLLVAVLLIGFVLRILPIMWGVPVNQYVKNYQPDEPKVYNVIMNFPHSYFSFDQFKGYGTFLQNFLGFLFLPLKLIKLTGISNLYEIIVIVLSRFVNVIFGTASILFTFFLAERIFDRRTALISSVITAFSFYHVINSSIITLDVVMSFLIAINFLLAFYAVEKNNLRSYILLGITSGILLGTKITGGLFLSIPIVLNLVYFLNIPGNVNKREIISKLIKNILVYLSVAVFIFLIFNSYVYIFPERYISFLFTEKKNLIDRTSISLWQIPGKWLRSCEISIGLPASLLFIIGLTRMTKRNFIMQVALFLFLLEYFLFWRWNLQPRYIVSVVPLISIFAANALIYFFERENFLIKAASVVMLLFVVGYSAYLSISGVILRFNDTRIDAAKYIDENVKEGESIGLAYTSEKFQWKYHAWRYPKVDFHKYKDVDFLKNPDIIVLNSYDFKIVDSLLNSNKLNDKYELDRKYYREWYKYSPPEPKILKAFDQLLNKKNKDYSLVKVFKKEINVPIDMPPPEIRIYKKN